MSLILGTVSRQRHTPVISLQTRVLTPVLQESLLVQSETLNSMQQRGTEEPERNSSAIFIPLFSFLNSK
ncbi:Uncharacterized protein DAT39_021102 [Clarias magur]|uniref:Uncharacterized protein n=1 Tax=Clarias magur TaxID=1594786 RepID=A0A8J4TFA8_CLAMG|nr:Uncharacterized protein DAT39_021102 [Clarias magur]